MILSKKSMMDDELKHPLHHIYLICGEESYLKRREYGRLLEALSAPVEDSFNFQVFSGTDIDIDKVVEACETLPVFAPRKFVAVIDSGLFGMKADALSQWEELLKNLPEETVLLFAELSDGLDHQTPAMAKKVEKLFDHYGAVFRWDTQKKEDILRFILAKAKKEGSKMERPAAILLLDYCGEDLTRLTLEMDKLLAYAAGGEILLDTVEALVIPRLETSVFVLSKAVEQGKYEQALTVLSRLEEMGEEPVAILHILSMQAADVFRAKASLSEGKSPENMQADFQYKGRDFVVRGAFKQAAHLSWGNIMHRLEILHQSDILLKTGAPDGFLILETAVTQLFLVRIGEN